jgi:diacylglycerol kinase family enzyme
LPLSPEEAAAVVARGDVGPMDLGIAGDGAFAHAATAGIAANFAERVRDVRGWRRPIVYPAMAWQAWRSKRILSLTVLVDGRPLTTPPPVQVAVVNAPRLGGRIGVTLPGAAVDDGLFDVIVTHRHALRQMIRTLTVLMRTGPAQGQVGGEIRSGRVVEIRGSADLTVALDGEPLAHAPLRAEAIAGACSVVRPKP